MVQYNKGGACYWEVDEFLRGEGFALYDILDAARWLGRKPQGGKCFVPGSPHVILSSRGPLIRTRIATHIVRGAGA